MKPPDAFRRSTRMALITRAWLVFFLTLAGMLAAGQATTNISGIVNTYHRVIEIIPAKGCLRVADPTGLSVNTPVMVIQMKGAAVSTANNSTFGDTTALNGAGNYEVGTICFIIGDSIFLFHQLLNSYTISGQVQLVQFGEYYSANVVDTVKALSWDSATGLGGVIAIYADQDITLNAPIYADSSGYSGGSWYNNSGTCNIIQQAGSGYVYDITATSNLNGAYKGESAAILSSTQNAAKGAPANGGGGGNNHNNSGGGGANLTAGGNGGGNSSSGPVGCNVANNWGRAGKALSSWGGTKLFMGGGGGAGHSNNGSVITNFGGNGGGIIFLWATTLIGNGHTISARGRNGGGSQSDGAGGGGAGGTIVMNIDSYSGSAFINVNGGSGGLSDNGSVVARCFGGGGGGSGGVVYFEGATPPVSVSISGGAAGGEINRDAGCNAAVPAAAGSSGQLLPNYTFSRSATVAGYCTLLLPSKLLYFRARLSDQSVLLSWQMEHPELVQQFTIEKRADNGNWFTIASVDAATGRTYYAAADANPFPGNSFYRLKITEQSQAVYYSETRKIVVGSVAADFTIYPNPASGQATVSGNFERNTQLQVTDMAGKTCWQKIITTNQAVISLPRLSPGLYLVRCKEVVKKLVIY